MNQNKLVKIVALLGILAGIVIIVLGFVVMDSFSGSWTDSTVSFGGDFYTYSYKATARAANNVDRLGDMLAQAFGYLLIAIGLTDAFYFGVKFASLLPEKKTEAVAEEESAPAGDNVTAEE